MGTSLAIEWWSFIANNVIRELYIRLKDYELVDGEETLTYWVRSNITWEFLK